MTKWQLVSPFNQGAKTYTFGTLKFTADADGVFELDHMPKEPIGAIARAVPDPNKPVEKTPFIFRKSAA